MKYEEYAGREGDIVTGIIQQSDSPLHAARPRPGRGAAAPGRAGARTSAPSPTPGVKAYIVEVRKTAKGPQIVVSRTHPGLIKRLFELEVPEIADGVVEIKACAREPGHRTKIAVWSNDANVDPVGACVGARGARVRMVVNELRGEKIDIVPFSDDSGRLRDEGALAGQGQGGAHPRGHRRGRGHRARLPAVAGHRQGGPERPPGRPPHRLAGRHQERDPAGRGGGLRSTRTGPRASGSSTPRPASRCGSRPRAARPCPPSSGTQAAAGDEAEAPAEARRPPSRPPRATHRRATRRRGRRRGRRRSRPPSRRRPP